MNILRNRKPILEANGVGYWLDAPSTMPNDLGLNTREFILFSSKESFIYDSSMWTIMNAKKRFLIQTSERHNVSFNMLSHRAYGVPESLLLDQDAKVFYSGLSCLDEWRIKQRPFDGMPDANSLVFIKFSLENTNSGFVLYRQSGAWVRSQAFAYMSHDGDREIDNLFSQWKLPDSTPVVMVEFDELKKFVNKKHVYTKKIKKSADIDLNKLKKLPVTYIVAAGLLVPTAYFATDLFIAFNEKKSLEKKVALLKIKNNSVKNELNLIIESNLPKLALRLDINPLSIIKKIDMIYLNKDKVKIYADDNRVEYEIQGTWIESNKPYIQSKYTEDFFGRVIDGCDIKRTTTGDATQITLSVTCQGNNHPLHRIARF